MSGKTAVWVFLGMLVIFALPDAAGAQSGRYIVHHAPGSCGYWRSSLYARDSIPYFAQHPPVYYSYPVRRTYGRSPYAWPPTIPAATTAKYRPQKAPLVVRNPYVVEKKVASAQPGPLRIINPHVVTPDQMAMYPGAVAPGQPKVVYPAEMDNR